MTTSLDELMADHTEHLGLVELICRESLGGWQAIAKYRKAIGGPWGVGCDTEMATAMRKALIAGEHELTLDRDQVTEWSPAIEPKADTTMSDLLDDI